MKKIRIFSLILALLFVFSTLASCVDEPITDPTETQPQESTSAEGNETTEPGETTEGGNETTEPTQTTQPTEPECTHDWAAATCETPKTCKTCGATEGEALGHNYTGTVTTEPTCEGKGVKTFVCANDASHTYTEEIDALGHDMAAATCTAPATCKRAGCGHTKGEAAGHTWDNGTPVTDAKCGEAGEVKFTCTVDGCGETRTETVAALAHDWAAATCTTPKTCQRADCGETEGDALGHNMITDAAVAATCTEPGLTEGSHCSRCDGATTAQEPVDALGHNMVTDAAVAATCTEPGLTEGSHCTRCDGATTAQEPVDALGHDWDVADCTSAKTCQRENCGATDGAALGHDMVTDAAVAATCTEPGLTEGSHCSRCDGATTAQEPVEALGHSWGEAVDGVKTCTRGNCGAKECNPDAHVIAETTSQNGTTMTVVGTCSTCNKEVYSYNHTFGETAPLRFFTAAQLATKAASGNNIGGAELSADGSTATIRNVVGTGNGFFNVFDGGASGKNVGNYVMVKYRTTSSDYWLWYVKTAGQDGYGTIKVNPIADGQWHTIIIDLSKTPNDRYVANDAGQYLAYIIRWDLMTVSSDSAKTVEVAFVATSDSLDNLEAVNNTGDNYIYYDRNVGGGLMGADPDNHTHIWGEATCDAAAKCMLCSATDGEALGHNWGEEVDGVKTCTRCGETDELPVQFQVQFVGKDEIPQLVDGKPTIFNDNLLTGTSDAGKGKIYFQGYGGTIGEIENVQFRVRSNTDGSIIQDWKDLDLYGAYPTTFSEYDDQLANLQVKIPGATKCYMIRGWMDISAFPGETVTIEVAFVMKDAAEGEEYFIFATETNCTNTETASTACTTHTWGIPNDDAVKTCTVCGAEKENLPVYFNATFSNSVNKVANKQPLVCDGITTSTGRGGLLYFYGWGGTIGEVDYDEASSTGGVMFRVADKDGNILEDWQYLDQYNTYPLCIANTSNLSSVQGQISGATHAYTVRGWIDLTEYLGDSVTVEIAFVMKGAPADDNLSTFITAKNVQVIE